MTNKELNWILVLAKKRRKTLLEKLEHYQRTGQDKKCDQIYSQLANVNDIIDNASKDLAKHNID